MTNTLRLLVDVNKPYRHNDMVKAIAIVTVNDWKPISFQRLNGLFGTIKRAFPKLCRISKEPESFLM